MTFDAVKNGDEQHALREDAGRDEVQIGNVARVHRAAAGEHLSEDEQPQRRLEGAADEFP